MQRKEFLNKLEGSKGKDLVVEVEGEVIQKATLEKIMHEIKEKGYSLKRW